MNYYLFIFFNFGILINFPLFLLVFSIKKVVYTFVLKITDEVSDITNSTNHTKQSMANVLMVHLFKVTQNKELFTFFIVCAIFGILCLVLMKYSQERFSILEDVSVDEPYHGNLEMAYFNMYVASNVCFWVSSWFFYRLFLVFLLCKTPGNVSKEKITSDMLSFKGLALWTTMYICAQAKTLLKSSGFSLSVQASIFAIVRIWIYSRVESWNPSVFFIIALFLIECLNIIGHIGDEITSLMTLLYCRVLYISIMGWILIIMYSI